MFRFLFVAEALWKVQQLTHASVPPVEPLYQSEHANIFCLQVHNPNVLCTYLRAVIIINGLLPPGNRLLPVTL